MRASEGRVHRLPAHARIERMIDAPGKESGVEGFADFVEHRLALRVESRTGAIGCQQDDWQVGHACESAQPVWQGAAIRARYRLVEQDQVGHPPA
jgi:hypothetical protein